MERSVCSHIVDVDRELRERCAPQKISACWKAMLRIFPDSFHVASKREVMASSADYQAIIC
jgi:hypothetical protein